MKPLAKVMLIVKMPYVLIVIMFNIKFIFQTQNFLNADMYIKNVETIQNVNGATRNNPTPQNTII